MSTAPLTKPTIDQSFRNFITDDVLALTDLDPQRFWSGFGKLINELAPWNRALLQERERLQQQINSWHQQHQGSAFDVNSYRDFVTRIGYLQPEPEAVEVLTTPIDAEISSVAGPQLVVPANNARFAINAVNARWGSLYDALYGSDAISHEGELAPGEQYNALRGANVIEHGKNFLDSAFPLAQGSHHDATRYLIRDGELMVKLRDRKVTQLRHPEQWVGLTGTAGALRSIVLRNNELHAEIRLDRSTSPGAEDLAGVQDIILESAITTIVDCEDSVAAVDSADKIEVYRNWLGLIRGNLATSIDKAGVRHIRTLNCDRTITGRDNKPYHLRGRSLMMIRNVGLLMNSALMHDAEGNPAPEGIIDAVVTALIGSLDVRGAHAGRNSRCGNIYIVKPKLHGPEEVEFTNTLFDRVEDLLRLPRHTIKLGIMDEERRTTINLKACLAAANRRVFFINTGFLDRTGDEIHTSMHAGPMLPKGEIKDTLCIRTYEDNNVDVGLECGLPGVAQIGKGMWAKPDNMAEMMATKQQHLNAGASTAWVPSPTAATLHALHYHHINVMQRQQQLRGRPRAQLNDILTPPLLPADRILSADEISAELENNVQGILGYVVRWIDQGIGCSKVPDIHQVALMEDRATLRISSQHIANWLLHGICSRQQVLATLHRMAALVDAQNIHDPAYQNMADDPEQSLAFQSAKALILDGHLQPNGYTEPLLHHYRLQAKNRH